VDALLAGSGGGAGSIAFGGTGGGAIKITAGGKLIIGKDIYANGGMGNSDSTNDAAKSGAGGSGGVVYLKASDLVINSGVSIRADGGPGAPLATDGNTGATDGGGTGSAAGGGGRVYLEGTHSFVNHGSLSNDNLSANKGGEAAHSPFPSGISGLQLWLDAAESSTITKDGSNKVSQWSDRSGNNKHATQSTASKKPTYTISDALLKNKATISSSSATGQIGLALPSLTLQEIFIVAYYDDGTDSTFDGNAALLSGPGSYGKYRIMGSSSSANWLTTSRFNDAGSFKNGSGSSSNSVLPMPASLLRFTSSSPRTETRGILYCIGINDRGWKGGVGEIIGLSATSSASDRQKIENYLAVKWGLSPSTRLGEDGTVRVVRPQVSSLEFTTGTLTVDTDKGEIAHSDGSFLLGEFTDKTFTAEDGTAYSYKTSTFTADKISLGSGVVVNLMGNNPVSLRTRNNGDITLGSTINVNGGNDPSNIGGTGKAGGFNGGAKDVDGYGPGKGKTKSVSSQGGGAAYGGNGLENANGYSLTYGTTDLVNHLLGGSGGGGGDGLWWRSRWGSSGTFCPWGWGAHHHFRRKNLGQWGGHIHESFPKRWSRFRWSHPPRRGKHIDCRHPGSEGWKRSDCHSWWRWAHCH
jgi:hypothetical protein